MKHMLFAGAACAHLLSACNQSETAPPPVDKAQDGVNNLVTGQLGQGGALQGVGDAFSKEGVNRAERGGKDDSVSNTTLHPFQNEDAKY